MRDSSRVGLQRQAAIVAISRPIKSWLTRVRLVSKFLRAVAARRCSTDKKVGYDSGDGVSQTRSCRSCPSARPGRSIHHRRLENAHHCGVRRVPAEVADPMRHIAAVAQRLACLSRRRGLADLDLKLAVQD